MTLEKAKVIDLPELNDNRGSLSFVENNTHMPFDIKRVYYLYNTPENASRGAHGHKELQQLIIAVSGSFSITLDDGYHKQTYFMNNPSQGLYVPAMMWRDLDGFSEDAVCLVLASDLYKESDYFRNYKDFINAAQR